MLGMISITPFVLLSILALSIYPYLKTKLSLPHPPSPFAWPIIGHLHLIGPVTHRSFYRLSSIYGPLVRLKLGSTPCVVASTPELAKEILKTHELVFSSRKQSTVIKILTKDTSFAFSSYGPNWKFIKKMCTVELLGTRTLNNFSHIRKNELLYFLRLMNRKSKALEAVNVTEELLRLTNNVISEMMLSIRCSSSKGDADEVRTIVREVTEIFGGFNISDSFGFLKSFDLQGFRKRAEDIQKRYDKLLENIISSREKTREKKKLKVEGEVISGDESVKDFLDMLLDIMEDETSEVKLTRDHIKALVLDFFTAATDTSAIAIEWALAELINNPEVLMKAQEEIDHVVGRNHLVSESDGPDLPYIQAIIKETFRLHPPIPMISRKSIQDCTISGYHIKANTLLFVNIWSIGRNPEYWDSPMGFRPERFLGQSGPMGLMDIKGQHFELLPFGTGRRGCPGISLAMQELPIVLAGMIQCFEWKVVNMHGENMDGGDGVVDMNERPGLTAPRLHDLLCVPVARYDRFSAISKNLESGKDD